MAAAAADPAADATERILRLAYYIAQRPTFTMSQTTLDIPDYGTVERGRDGEIIASSPSGEALRRKFRRDLADIEARFGIGSDFDEAAQVYRVRPAFFSARERRALLSAMALVEVAGIDVDDDIAQLGAAVDAAGRRVVVTVNEHLTTIRDAIARRHPIRFRYHDHERMLEAWVAGLARNHWYVVGHERNARQRRVFRLDRIQLIDGQPPITIDASMTYTTPEWLEPERELRVDPNDWGRDQPALTTVAVHPDHVGRFRADVGGMIVDLGASDTPPDAERSAERWTERWTEGWTRVEVVVRDHESFRDRVLRMGDNARVVAPEPMVALVRDWLRMIVEVG